MNQTTHVDSKTWDEKPDDKSAPSSSNCYAADIDRAYMVKFCGVVRAIAGGGDCRGIELRFASMKQRDEVLRRIRDGQLG
jgi:hypothetical protein